MKNTSSFNSSLASPLGELPLGWRLVRLKDVTTKIGSGATPTGGSATYLPQRERYAFIRSQNVFDRHFDTEGLAFISDKHANQLSGAAVRTGDILLNITGDGVTFGRACLAPVEVLPACVNQHVTIVRADPKKAEPGYLLSYVTHPNIKKYMETFNAGGSRRALTKGNIESFVLPLPPLPIQHRIADILGALDDKIEMNRRISATLEAMAQALFKHWFVDFGPFQSGPFVETELGPVPEGWRVSKLPEVVSVNPIRRLKKGEVAPYLEMSNMPTVLPQALAWYERGYTSGSKFENGDVLVAKITPCLENGKTAFVDFLKESDVGWGSTEFIVLRSRLPLPEEYAYYLARSEDFRAFLIRNMVGTSGRQRVPESALGTYALAIPPPEVAAEFKQRVHPMMLFMKQLADESRALSTTRDDLLPRLLSGKVAVEAIEDTTAHMV
jgi:type I restriction enzyme, S subunit